MMQERAIRLELKIPKAPAVGSRLEGLARLLHVGLRILRARVTPTGSRYEIEVCGSEAGVARALRALAGFA